MFFPLLTIRPPNFCPMFDQNVKSQLYAISLSAIVYGISLVAFVELVQRFARKRQKEVGDTLLLLFIISMFLLGTAAIAQGLFYLRRSGSQFLVDGSGTISFSSSESINELEGSDGLNYFTRLDLPLSLPFAVLGSNGLLVRRRNPMTVHLFIYQS